MNDTPTVPRAGGQHSRLIRIAGAIGLALYIAALAFYRIRPSPDRLFVAVVLASVAVGAAREGITRFAPFIGLLFVYESFRGAADELNSRVSYEFLINLEQSLFGETIPSIRLQNWFYHDSAGWLEMLLLSVYVMHFLVPFILAFVIWRRRESMYWTYVGSILTVSFAGFLTFLAFPAAPPWLAAEEGYIDGFRHVSIDTISSLGLQSAPTLYRSISPNAVAPVPSLHAAYATLFAIFVFRAFGRKWGTVALIYPVLIYFGTVYLGEHYLVDELIGSAYAFGAVGLVGWVRRRYQTAKVELQVGL